MTSQANTNRDQTKPNRAPHQWGRYFVVEPLEGGGFQIWKVSIKLLTRSDNPDEDDIITVMPGAAFWWTWEKIGGPFVDYNAARLEAFKIWYG